MKHFSTLLLAMFAIGASAQSGGTGALLDETYQFTDDGDGLFRYVFAYDSNKQRSSETIYYKERNAGVWGSESLYEVGNYSYQFDSKGRLKVKEVKYSLGKPQFQTYRIMVDYNDNAAAGEAVSTFKRYTLADDNNYQLEEQWSLYANGQLASHSLFNSYDAVSHRYDENGTINAILSYDFSGDKLVTKVTKSGTLNDSTIVHYEDGMPSWTERYRYDGKTGRPLEYTKWGKTVDAFHNVWEYDAQGRIVLDEHYIDSADDDVDYPTGAALSGKRSQCGARLPFMSAGRSEAAADARKADAAPRRNRTESALTEPEWKLDERITYKYFNDEVYPVSNSWRSVMYMEGPLSECAFLEKGDETEPDYEERIVFTRDASGKLTAVNHTYSKETDIENSSVYVVDAAGHVTRRTYTNKETSGDRTETYVEDNQYVWDSDHCVSMVETNGYTPGQQTKTSHVYTYDTAANKFTDELRITHENGTDEPSTVTYTVQQNGTSVEATNKESAYCNSRYIREVQQEDVSFIAPNMLKDFDGAYPEPRTVISVKGRVVTTATGPRGKYYGYVEVPALNDADNQYLTLAPGQYFSVKRVGNQLVCSDIDGFPVYVVEGNLLKKEYIYLDNTSSVTPQASVAPVAKAADGVECTEVEYFYSQYGLLVGQTLTDISADGKRTENISIEYKYDEATGIGTYEATTAKMQLSGRSLGLTDGTTFSVYTLGGTQLAANVADYTFASSGVYIVKVGGKSVKLTVK